jgi:hypothetical protein
MPEIPKDLAQANELIQRLIGEVNEPMICGFLPLSQAQEDAVITHVRSAAQSTFARPKRMLTIAPAAMAYALAAAPSRTLTTGGNFWKSLESDLGLNLTLNDRADFSTSYLLLCKKLGLVSGTIPECGWHVAAPFIFQAGILHHWSDNLASGIKSTLRVTPAPDVLDDVALGNFASSLGAHVHGQPTLVRLLGTEVGPLIVRRLITSYIRGNWEILPPHLQKPIREAFAEVGQDLSLHSPYIRYNEGHGRIELALPRQHDRITTTNTVWRTGSLSLSARAERALLLEELPNTAVSKITLEGLSQGFRKQEFEVSAHWAGQALRIFRQDNGRERTVDLSHGSIQLPAARYIAALAQGTSTDRVDDLVERSGHSELSFDLRPGAAPVEFRRDEQVWSLTAELKAGVFIDRTRANTILAEDGLEVHYGEDLGLVAYVPTEGIEQPLLRANIRCTNIAEVSSVSGQLVGILRQGVFAYSDGLDSLFTSFSRLLEPNIYYLTIDFSHEGRSFSHKLIYWKALRDENPNSGFRCDQWPKNVDEHGCKGFKRVENRLCPEPHYHAPSCTISLTGGVTIRLPRLGILALIKDPEFGTEDEPQTGIPLVVDENERRVVAFTIGGGKAWKLRAGERELATLTPDRPRFAISLAGLAQETGGSGRVEAACEGQQSIRLLSYVRPLSCTTPAQFLDHEKNLECWKFRLSEKNLHSLAIRVTEMTDDPDTLAGESKVIALRDAAGALQPQPLNSEAELIQVVVEKKEADQILVVIKIRIIDMDDRLLLVDVLRKSQEGDDWEFLDAIERTGYSKLRIVVRGTRPAPSSASWWRLLKREEYPLRVGGNGALLGEKLSCLPPKDLDRALARATDLLSFKYPGNVWNIAAKPFRDLVPHLAKYRYVSAEPIPATWWKRASIELVQHTDEAVTPFSRDFIFANNTALLGLKGSHMGMYSGSGTLVDRCLNIPAAIHRSGGLYAFLGPTFHKGTVCPRVIQSFKNFAAVAMNKDRELSQFQLGVFVLGSGRGFPSLAANTSELRDRRISRDTVGLLSAEHFLLAIRALNRRARPLETASQGDGTHPLTFTAQALMQVSSGFHRTAPLLSHWPYKIPTTDQLWAPPNLESKWSEFLAHAAWLLAGVTRAEAAGWLGRYEAETKLLSLLGGAEASPQIMQKNLRIILSLAPELFAYYFALFSLAYLNKTYP